MSSGLRKSSQEVLSFCLALAVGISQTGTDNLSGTPSFAAAARRHLYMARDHVSSRAMLMERTGL